MTFLLLTILAHVIADFILQTDTIAEQKRNMKKVGFFKHWLILLLTTFFVIHVYSLKIVIIFSVIISILHILIDFIKELGFNELKKVKKIEKYFNTLLIYGYFLDQLLHLLILFVSWKIIPLKLNMVLKDIYLELLSPINIVELNTIFPLDRSLFVVIVYLYITFGGAIFVKLFINCIFPKNDKEKEEQPSNNAGKNIGILERAIILTLIIYNSLQSVVIVFAAKSIARFGELKNKGFAEYYLVGTLLSVLIGILGGLLLKKIVPLF